MSARRSVGTACLVLVVLAGCSRPEPEPETGGEPAAGTAAPSVLYADVSRRAGVAFDHDNGATARKYLPEIMGSGAAALDYDGDGWMDLYLVQSGPLPWESARKAVVNRLLRNQGDGSFEDVTERSGAGHPGYGMGAVAGDLDNDGDADLYVVNFGPDALLRNNGDGTFTEVTRETGIDSPLWGSSAALADFDRDGWLDLYVVNYLEFSREQHVDCGRPSRGIVSYCHPDVYAMAPDVAFRGLGGGRFADATTAWGLVDSSGKGLGAVAADLLDDGWPEIYVANDSTPNFLFHNLSGRGFEEVALLTGVGYNEDGMTEAGMGTDAGDLDGDGRLDLFVTNLNNETNALYLAAGEYYDYGTREAGLFEGSFRPVGFGTDLADLDNDGDLDIVVVNGHVIDNIELTDDAQSFRQPGQVFLNEGGARFTELPAERVGDLAVPGVGRGTVSLDFDHDGRLDLLATYNNEPARLLRNGWRGGGWLSVDLVSAAGANRDAIGARVVVAAAGRRQLEEKKAGSSYQSSSDPRLHFGLGTAGNGRVVVRWPSGRRQAVAALAAGRFYRLVESGRVDSGPAASAAGGRAGAG